MWDGRACSAAFSFYGGRYDHDSRTRGAEHRCLRRGTTLAIGSQNAFNTYSQVSAIAMSVGERYSEYMPWGYSGAYYYVRLGYGWGS